jgi:hypothetical protein
MTWAHDLFMIFIVYDLGMYDELGRRTRPVVQGSRAVVFQMMSRDVLRVENVIWFHECVLNLRD